MRFHLRTSMRGGVYLAIVAVLALAQPVAAEIIAVSSPADLGGNDSINWTAGAHPNPFSTTTVNATGVSVQVSGLFAPLSIFTRDGSIQGPSGQSADVNVGQSLTLTFGTPIQGGGGYITPNFLTLTDSMFDAVSLDASGPGGVFGETLFRITSSAQNSQPVFLGLVSDSANITTLTYRIVSFDIASGEFEGAISSVGNIYLLENSSPLTAAPEPASLTLLGLGLLGFAGYGWRRRRVSVA